MPDVFVARWGEHVACPRSARRYFRRVRYGLAEKSLFFRVDVAALLYVAAHHAHDPPAVLLAADDPCMTDLALLLEVCEVAVELGADELICACAYAFRAHPDAMEACLGLAPSASWAEVDRRIRALA